MATLNPRLLRQLRETRGYSQSQIADALGISRPTYVQIENGDRELKLSEAKNLATVLGISFSELAEGRLKTINVSIPKENTASNKQESEMRINIPKESVEKFKDFLLYVLQKVGAKPNIGETVLYKLLYFIDFDYYEKFEEQLMGLKYIKNHHGPSPLGFSEIIKKMEDTGQILRVKHKYFQYDQKKYIPLTQPNLSKLNAEEIKHIDSVLSRLSDMNAIQIRQYSHDDVPWLIANEGKPLEYEAVFYRTPKTSVRNYEKD